MTSLLPAPCGVSRRKVVAKLDKNYELTNPLTIHYIQIVLNESGGIDRFVLYCVGELFWRAGVVVVDF